MRERRLEAFRSPVEHIASARDVRLPLHALLLCLAVGCSADSRPNISPEHLFARIQAGSPPLIVDVRSRGEYEGGQVPGALHVPFYSVWSHRGEIEGEAGEPVVLYCAHGHRAWIAKLLLWPSDESPVIFLEGHMKGWRERGLPVENIENT